MRKRHGICGKPQADGSRCMNSAGCRIPHPTTSAATATAATAAAQAVAAEQNFNRQGYDYILDNEDFAGMSESVTADMRSSLMQHHTGSVPQEQETDSLGYWLSNDASDDVRALTHSVSAEAPSEQVEAACVVASELVHAMERHDEYGDARGGYGQYGPAGDLRQTRQALRCIAVHPNATQRAVRQAVRAEGKYAGREVLRKSRDPEMLEFALNNSDTGVWYAVTDDGTVNPSLQSHRLVTLVEMTKDPVDAQHGKYGANFLESLRSHPNLTEDQRSALPGR